MIAHAPSAWLQQEWLRPAVLRKPAPLNPPRKPGYRPRKHGSRNMRQPAPAPVRNQDQEVCRARAIGGVVTESSAISGANVEMGSVLFRIVDTNTLYIKAAVPESDFPKLRQLSGGEIEMPGSGQVRPSNRLVSIGRFVDEATRTVPVIYEVDNRDHGLAVNQTVFLRLLLTPSQKTAAVPEAAIVDDAGRPIVFVQIAGEHFVRRPVKLGVRNAGLVQVLEGVQAGDRVVTKGAYLVRLSTMSSAVPTHGHVH